MTIRAVGPSAVDGMTRGSRCLDGDHPSGGSHESVELPQLSKKGSAPEVPRRLGQAARSPRPAFHTCEPGSDAGPAPLCGRSLSPP